MNNLRDLGYSRVEVAVDVVAKREANEAIPCFCARAWDRYASLAM